MFCLQAVVGEGTVGNKGGNKYRRNWWRWQWESKEPSRTYHVKDQQCRLKVRYQVNNFIDAGTCRGLAVFYDRWFNKDCCWNTSCCSIESLFHLVQVSLWLEVTSRLWGEDPCLQCKAAFLREGTKLVDKLEASAYSWSSTVSFHFKYVAGKSFLVVKA